MLSYMDVFVRIASNHEDVATAEEQFLFKVYGAEQFSTQNKFSHATLIMGVSTGPTVVGGGICLPPNGGGKQGNTTWLWLWLTTVNSLADMVSGEYSPPGLSYTFIMYA